MLNMVVKKEVELSFFRNQWHTAGQKDNLMTARFELAPLARLQ